jgi:hypothetical protein
MAGETFDFVAVSNGVRAVIVIVIVRRHFSFSSYVGAVSENAWT